MKRIRGKREISDNELVPGGNKLAVLPLCLVAMPIFLTCGNPMLEPPDAVEVSEIETRKRRKTQSRIRRKNRRKQTKSKAPYGRVREVKGGRRASTWMILEFCVAGDIC